MCAKFIVIGITDFFIFFFFKVGIVTVTQKTQVSRNSELQKLSIKSRCDLIAVLYSDAFVGYKRGSRMNAFYGRVSGMNSRDGMREDNMPLIFLSPM